MWSRRSIWLPAVFVVVLVGLGACRKGPPAAPRNVVLVTIDTLRADRLGVYGATAATSPVIDALARTSTLFDAAVPTCPATAPSVASILTGNHRATHRVFGNGWNLPPAVETVAERLQGQGFRTVARVTNPAIDVGAGFAQGFDEFAFPAGLERAGPGMLEGEPLVADVQQVLERLGKERFFLWIHFMDPHGPYFPPQAYRDRFPAAPHRWPDEVAALPIGTSNYGLDQIPQYQGVNSESAPASYRARYDAEVRYVDDHVAAVVAALRARGLWDDTLFVLTADHGESLGEHHYYFAHGWYLYDDELRVPLLLHGPGVPAGGRVRQSVSLVDLAPTLLDLLGLPASETMEGRSLRPLFAGDGPDREVFAQTFYGEGLAATRSGRLKYVFKPSRAAGARPGSDPPFPDTVQEWLFDLAADPGETNNLVTERADVAGPMRERLQAWLRTQEERGRGHTAEQVRPGGPPVRVLGDPQIERQLRALGYLD